MPTPENPLVRFATQALFVIWLPLVIVPGAYLLGGHLAGLPTPGAHDAEVEAALARSRGPGEQNAWIVRHILYAACGCSMRILDHLAARGPRVGASERIVLVDGDDALAARAERAGFAVERVTADELLGRYRVEASPLFAVADPQGRARYVGGYTERKQSARVLEGEILDALHRGEDVAPLPTLGCAVSRRLRERTDPLGVR